MSLSRTESRYAFKYDVIDARADFNSVNFLKLSCKNALRDCDRAINILAFSSLFPADVCRIFREIAVLPMSHRLNSIYK